MKKAIALAMSACMTLSLLTGCGGAASSGSSSAAASSGDSSTASSESSAPAAEAGDVSLSVSWWGGDSRHEATQKALDTYASENGVTITTNYNA